MVLDERGKAPTSVELAQHLKGWQQNGEHVCFIIGGADGMTDRLKQQANMMMRLSSLTLPHGMVRVLLTEQLYRAVFDFAQPSVSSGIICFEFRDKTAMPPCRFERE